MRIDAAPLSLLLALAARAELAHTPSPEAPLPLCRAGPLLLPLAARIRRLPCSMAHLWPAQLLPSGALRAPPFLVGIVSTARLASNSATATGLVSACASVGSVSAPPVPLVRASFAPSILASSSDRPDPSSSSSAPCSGVSSRTALRGEFSPRATLPPLPPCPRDRSPNANHRPLSSRRRPRSSGERNTLPPGWFPPSVPGPRPLSWSHAFRSARSACPSSFPRVSATRPSLIARTRSAQKAGRRGDRSMDRPRSRDGSRRSRSSSRRLYALPQRNSVVPSSINSSMLIATHLCEHAPPHCLQSTLPMLRHQFY
ncbi:unnamed protein product [Closterium sp. NIES-65]|nr:unnamed protein product [Closterium sp. NIES-65]